MSVVMGPERRRRWRPEEKLALVAEAFTSTSRVATTSSAVPLSALGNLGGAATVGASGSSLNAARTLGSSAEEAVFAAEGFVKNTNPIPSVAKNFRVPDILDDAKGVVGEVKNVSYQSLTGQIQDEINYAKSVGYEYQLYVRGATSKLGAPTQLAKPLQNLVDSGEVILKDIPPSVTETAIELPAAIKP